MYEYKCMTATEKRPPGSEMPGGATAVPHPVRRGGGSEPLTFRSSASGRLSLGVLPLAVRLFKLKSPNLTY